MFLVEWYRQADAYLKGRPDQWLTIFLLLFGIACIIVALKADPVTKGIMTAWVVLP